MLYPPTKLGPRSFIHSNKNYSWGTKFLKIGHETLTTPTLRSSLASNGSTQTNLNKFKSNNLVWWISLKNEVS